MRIAKFLASPYLLVREYRYHAKACKVHRANPTDKNYAATWRYFNRYFNYLIPAFIMSVAYLFAILGIIIAVTK